MEITTEEIIVWLIVGALAGTLAGAVVKGDKKGFGPWKNIVIGLIGAIIGGLLFNLFDIQLGNVAIKFDDLVSAVLGSFLLILGLWLYKKKKGGGKKKAAG